MLIALQQTGCVRNDSWGFQAVARLMTRRFARADVLFSVSGEDPKEAIRGFCLTHGIPADVDAASWEWELRPEAFACLNDFFARRYAALRVAEESTLVSPASAVVSEYRSVEDVDRVKGSRYTLAACGVPDADRFVGHDVFYFYLSPADYHCFHAPCSGVVEAVVDVAESTRPCSGSVKPDLLTSRPSVLTHNRRVVVVVRGDAGVTVALVILGGFLVDSVRVHDAVKPGRRLEKGQFLGNFALGGSAILLLSDANLTLDPKLARALQTSGLPVKVAVASAFAEAA